MPHTYYVDSRALPGGSGLSAESAACSWRELTILPGDSILFARGSFFRDVLELPEGTAEAPLYIGAYGEGEKPVFCGSVQLAQPEKWKEIRENIWEYTDSLPSEPCNLIFEDGSCGILAWEEDDLVQSGQWHFTALASDQNFGLPADARLLMFSRGNPASVHSSIEAAVYGSRHMLSCRAHATFEPPRRSEIWPQPMGHHLFIWRMPHDTENGSITVRNNTFGSSPYGAAVYSIVSPEAEAQFVFEGNKYEKSEGLLVRWNGQNYLAEHQDNPLR